MMDSSLVGSPNTLGHGTCVCQPSREAGGGSDAAVQHERCRGASSPAAAAQVWGNSFSSNRYYPLDGCGVVKRQVCHPQLAFSIQPCKGVPQPLHRNQRNARLGRLRAGGVSAGGAKLGRGRERRRPAAGHHCIDSARSSIGVHPTTCLRAAQGGWRGKGAEQASRQVCRAPHQQQHGQWNQHEPAAAREVWQRCRGPWQELDALPPLAMPGEPVNNTRWVPRHWIGARSSCRDHETCGRRHEAVQAVPPSSRASACWSYRCSCVSTRSKHQTSSRQPPPIAQQAHSPQLPVWRPGLSHSW